MVNVNKLYDIMNNYFGDRVIEYRKQWSVAGKNGYVPNYPLHLNFELNHGCNLKCDFCLYSIPLQKWNYHVDASKKIPFYKYQDIIKDGSKKGLFSVEFNGINEPLLKKDICRYIEYIHKKDILVSSLHTNAMLLTEDMSINLIDSGLKIIIFSVDAINREIYNQIRVNSNYDMVLNNINSFLDIRKKRKSIFPLVQMSFSINKFNYTDLSAYIDYWEPRVDLISTSDFCNPFIGGDKEKYAEDKYRFNSFRMGDCYEPYQRLFIRNDGKVHSCCSFFGGEYVVGDIYKKTIQEIWNDNRIKKIRLEVNSKNGFSICNKCRMSMRGKEK
jgi:radical SAM protein with 4Fe4S-binding SPASM domain